MFMHTKVLIDTFVQWIRLCASGLITTVQQGTVTRKSFGKLVLKDM